jgi:hypothetical protein
MLLCGLEPRRPTARYYDFSERFPSHFVFLRLTVLTVRSLCFVLSPPVPRNRLIPPGSLRNARLSFILPCPMAALLLSDVLRPPAFPYDPLYICPALRSRPRFPARFSQFTFAPTQSTVKASCIWYFEAQSRGFCTRCLRFTNLVAKAHASDLWSALASGDVLNLSG